MKCSRCGHDNDSDALYCVECGLVLNGAHSCRACHNWLNPGYKYCIYCGKRQGANVAKIAGISTLVVVLLAVAFAVWYFYTVNTPETPVANNDQIIELIQKNLGEVSAGHVDLSQPPAQLNTVLSDFAAPDSVCVEDRFIGQRSTPKEFLNHLWLTGEVYQVISVTKNDAKKITELVVTK